MMVDQEIRLHLYQIVKDLVRGAYSTFEEDERIGRLTIDELKDAIEEYPGILTMPPDESFERFDIYEVEGLSSPTWAIDFDLWYDNQPSDLTLSITLKKNKLGEFSASIDNVHVL